MPTYALAGAASGCPAFDAIKSIEFHRSNILTGADFAQPPHKSLLQKLVDFLRSKGHPL